MSGKRQIKDNESAFARFVRTEITAPEKRQGNINIAISLTVFTGAIVFLRNFGDLLAMVMRVLS
ncbi:hypothetical protein BZG36_01778 [Bifiguratus adelaidae]|uniref:Uncharacterized protein n=1 Tax=Bifiguratus adelaidae TaxID=1938954 RepID=A0A261Y2W5_9FUNG|nr:hypothetical protein BZG36_01778 [Bifiguratus adelaidae]